MGGWSENNGRGFAKKMTPDFSNFDLKLLPILSALCAGPKTVSELAIKSGGVPHSTIRTKLNDLCKRGLVVHRFDGKYQMVVILRAEALPTATADGTLIHGLGEAVMVPPKWEKPEPAVPNRDKVRKNPDGALHASPRALKLAESFKVPPFIYNKGEANLAKVGRCDCGKATPLRYGTVTVCPNCARKDEDVRL